MPQQLVTLLQAIQRTPYQPYDEPTLRGYMTAIASYENPKVLDAYDLSQQSSSVLRVRDERIDGLPMVARVALVGKMHAGKSSVAGIFKEAGYKPVSLADEVKELALVAANAVQIRPSLYMPRRISLVDRKDLDGSKSVYRGLLQWVGTYGREQISADIWVKIFEAKYLTQGAKELLVIDDMRFPNEANMLRTKGFSIVRVERGEDERKSSVIRSFQREVGREPTKKELKQMMNADSEKFVDDIRPDIIIKNNSTLAGLQNAARRIAKKPYGYGD